MGATLSSLCLRLGKIEWLFHANSNLGQYTQTQLWEVFWGRKSKGSNIIMGREFCEDREEKTDDNIYRLWPELPYDVTTLIIMRLGVTDRVRMCAVCKAWRLAALAAHKNLPPAPEVPWLLFAPPTPPGGSSKSSYNNNNNNNNNPRHVNFFSISEGKVHKFNVPKPIQGGWCCGSSKGWLVMAKGTQKKPQIFIFNPISGAHLQLPSIATIPSFHGYFDNFREAKPNFSLFLSKIILSSDDPSSCTVSAIFEGGKALAICKPSDKKWTVFQIKNFKYQDMLFVKGTLYVLYTLSDLEYEFGQMTVLNITVELENSCKVSVKLIRSYFNVLNYYNEQPPGNKIEDDVIEVIFDRDNSVEVFLVESPSRGKPLVVAQYCECIRAIGDEDEEEDEDEDEDEDDCIPYNKYFKTSKFEVYQLNLIDGNNSSKSGTSVSSSSYECKLITNLRDQVLFIGSSGTLSLSATRNYANGNGHGGLRGGCIYFVDSTNYGSDYHSLVSHESGMFSTADGKIRRCLPCLSFGANIFYWFTPSPSM